MMVCLTLMSGLKELEHTVDGKWQCSSTPVPGGVDDDDVSDFDEWFESVGTQCWF